MSTVYSTSQEYRGPPIAPYMHWHCSNQRSLAVRSDRISINISTYGTKYGGGACRRGTEERRVGRTRITSRDSPSEPQIHAGKPTYIPRTTQVMRARPVSLAYQNSSVVGEITQLTHRATEETHLLHFRLMAIERHRSTRTTFADIAAATAEAVAGATSENSS